MAKLTTEEFIKKAQAVHGDRYDYSKVKYVDSQTKVCIICKEHGEFWQRPSHHINGHGCAKCSSDVNAANMRKWTEKRCREVASGYTEMKAFRIESKDAYNAALKHNWLKDYSWLTYKIDVSRKSKQRHFYSQEDIIERLRSLFGNRYSYEKVVYRAMKVPITLVCHEKDSNGIEHGDFSMRPDNIFSSKQGCPKCWNDRRGINQRMTRDEFIARAKVIHGNKYEYHKVDYVTTKMKVLIVCPVHGDFTQTPANHLRGKGCPYCSGTYKKWNKTTCEQEARKYTYISDFRRRSGGACHVAQSNGWLKDYTWLKKRPLQTADYDKDTKYIYAYEFREQKAVYVGLTNSMIKRDWAHRNKNDSSVYRFAHENNCDIPTPKQLEKNVPIYESGERESYWVEYYKERNWMLLNRAKTGERSSSIGATFPLKWNKKAIRGKAKECDYNLTLFATLYPGAYEAIQSRYKGLLNELFPNRVVHTHHTVEDALLVVNKGNYTNRSQLRHDCIWAYRLLSANGLLDEIFGKPKEYTKEEALKEADEYKSIEQIRLKNHLLWSYLRKNGLFSELKPTIVMHGRIKTVEEAWDISQYFNNISALSNYSKKAYHLLRDAGLLRERYPQPVKYIAKSEKMGKPQKTKDQPIEKPGGIIEVDFELCKKAYEQCAFVSDVKKHFAQIYRIAKEQGWHEDLKGFCYGSTTKWTRTACEEVVRKYTFLRDLVHNAPNVYNVIKKKHWDDLLKPLRRVQHAPYNYTLEEIKEICSQYNSLLELSKERKDIENYCRRKSIDLYELMGWKNLRNRKVAQVLDGEEIAIFSSITEAARAINVPRNRMWEYVNNGKSYKGFVWRYKENN